MEKVCYQLTVPSTSFGSPTFQKELGRKCSLTYNYETDDASELIEETLLFDGMEAFKATYYTANSVEVFNAYDKVLEIGSSKWLDEIKTNLENTNSNTIGLKHFRIFFDDGPCYEFIARSLTVSKETKRSK